MADRLDVVLVERGIASGRDRAKEMILAGQISVNGKAVTKPAFKTEETDVIEFTGEKLPFVSRGGLKLKGASDAFGIDLTGLVCIDIGASTGGFTDCMLSLGAKKVYAVDVGTGQLHQKLLNDSRVINMEKTNIRYVENFPEKADFIGTDVSFISLSHVFPSAYRILKPEGTGVFLIKPQFEAGKGNIGKGGIVKDKAVHDKVIKNVVSEAEKNGFLCLGLEQSPIKGSDGNTEYLLYVKMRGDGCEKIPYSHELC